MEEWCDQLISPTYKRDGRTRQRANALTNSATCIAEDARNIREVEAEGVALLCSGALALDGPEYSRGYLQHWLRGDEFPERSCQRIFKAADTILRAGRETAEKAL